LKSEQTPAGTPSAEKGTPSTLHSTLFAVFNEIGIIQQLASTVFNRKLPQGLYVSHFAVINHLMRLGDGRTPLSLSRAFQVTKGTMTNTLGGLTKRHFVELKPHATDGRSKLVWLTDEGREFHAAAIAALGDALSVLGEEIDVDKLAEILPVLSDLRKTLDQHRDI